MTTRSGAPSCRVVGTSRFWHLSNRIGVTCGDHDVGQRLVDGGPARAHPRRGAGSRRRGGPRVELGVAGWR